MKTCNFASVSNRPADARELVNTFIAARRSAAICRCAATNNKLNKQLRQFAQHSMDPPGHRSCAPMLAHGPFPEFRACCWVCCDCQIDTLLEDIVVIEIE